MKNKEKYLIEKDKKWIIEGFMNRLVIYFEGFTYCTPWEIDPVKCLADYAEWLKEEYEE